jgi:hypothetical protein
MQFTNHQSTQFFATTDSIGQSLVNDFWSVINLWQDAADNGYGLYSKWGQVIDTNLMVWDWFCDNILRNLVAITVFSALFMTDLCQRLWQSGRVQSAAAMVAQKAKPMVLCISSAALVALAVLINPARSFDTPLPSIDPNAHLIDGVPADVWMMRRIVVV